jgi:hypothetical protein
MNELERVEQMIVDNDLDRDLLRKVMTSVRHALEDSIDSESMLSDIMIELHKLQMGGLRDE